MNQTKLIKAPVHSNRRWQERQRAKRLLHQLGAELESSRSCVNYES